MIVYFDGVCGLCNGLVDFLLRRDSVGRLRFAPLQGVSAARDLPPALRAGLDTFVLRDDRGREWTRSDAVLRAIAALGGVWRLASVARAVPRLVRDPVYGWVARHRYAWFGRRETCRLPEPDERARFLP